MSASHRRPSATRRSRSKGLNAVREGSAKPYVCSNCGFGAVDADPNWHDPKAPVSQANGKKPRGCFERCPENEGPDSGTLLHPKRWFSRTRATYPVGTKRIRACIPTMLYERTSRRLGARPLTTPGVVERELHLDEYLASHGPDERIDLKHAESRAFIIDEWHVHRGKSGNWQIPMRLGKGFKLDEWGFKISDLRRVNVKARGMRDTGMASVLVDTPRSLEEVKERMLYVPFDLGRALDDQLERARTRLREIQLYVHRFTGKGVSKDKRGNLWRDMYIYYLRETTPKTISEIAREVFPDQDKDSASYNVKQILRRVRRTLTAADFDPRV